MPEILYTAKTIAGNSAFINGSVVYTSFDVFKMREFPEIPALALEGYISRKEMDSVGKFVIWGEEKLSDFGFTPGK